MLFFFHGHHKCIQFYRLQPVFCSLLLLHCIMQFILLIFYLLISLPFTTTKHMNSPSKNKLAFNLFSLSHKTVCRCHRSSLHQQQQQATKKERKFNIIATHNANQRNIKLNKKKHNKN